MEKKKFDQLQEELFYEKLDNGLSVYILPKPQFNKTYATFTTKYGSIDDQFVPLNEKDFVKVPDGIAHFLEHKMFEKEDGDVFQQFSENGASANAFTSFTRTAYLFSSTSKVKENLATLIDFVQSPYFTEETVEKEKGIIGQEITMYDDNADWRLYFGTIQNMYHNHPVKVDIAGTVDSIADITKDHLYQCYNTFYHPSNMVLFVVGSVNPDEIIEQVRSSQQEKSYEQQSPIERKFENEPSNVNRKHHQLNMDVQVPKCMVGLKASNVELSGDDLLRRELAVNTALEVLFGRTSSHYTKLYEEGLIDDSFTFDFSQEYGFGFALIGGNTREPDKLSQTIQTILAKEAKNSSITEEQLNSVKKKNIGGFLRSLNSPEFIANQFTRYAFNEMDLFDAVPTLETLSKDDIGAALADLAQPDRMTSFFILPKEEEAVE
ncbi:insulinase family protein [Jeotgalibacillus sp. S-D1]|uniref:EF-P 5-aminopentanol modification-associated protein YfmH n=1 Tax=Jeotgalibacillus sp. S-D1 TaxID=2552189 RepID=UPI00105A34C5|nr:pitrilysin family protein [Jeotgalibacillus sp. S-D1]TDL34991.1 insulinase family protein [Jeotgalibacillus sp. S-D1]